jgi:hypothetical protein
MAGVELAITSKTINISTTRFNEIESRPIPESRVTISVAAM